MRPLSLVVAAGLVIPLTASSAVAAPQPSPVQTQKARGVVFDDVNRNGKRDAREGGISGVPVSNGRDVVTTDAEGRYELSVDDQTIVFVSKPRGWMVPVDENNLPQFYYRHYPNGSPVALKYGGVKPTGPLPAFVDFPLHRQKEPVAFSPVVFADPQTKTLQEVGDLERDVVQELVGTSAPFGLTVGDVVNDPLDLFGTHNAAVGKIGIPWWNLPGNHDMDYDAPDDKNATDTFKNVYGPTNYSFDYGRVHVIALDNVRHNGPGKGYVGALSPEQLSWIRQDLALVPADRLVVVATHIPLKNPADSSPGNNTEGLRDLLGILSGRAHVYSISGHDTSNSNQVYLGTKDGWTGMKPFHHQILAEVRGGGWTKGPKDGRGVRQADMADGNPNGYYRITFEGTRYRPQFKPASLPADFLMRVSYRDADGQAILPGGVSGSEDFENPATFTRRDLRSGAGTHVETNVFEAGARHKVEMSVDGRRFVRMAHSRPVNDPYATALYERLEGTKDAPVKPEPSFHLWSAPLPGNLTAGRHTVTVRSTSPWGQVAQRTSEFTVIR